MAAIKIEINGIHLLNASLDELQSFHVFVNSSLQEEVAATLEVHGGRYTDVIDGHRIWVSDRGLLPGQSVKVSFIESDGPFELGKTMREMFPDEEPSEEYDFTVTDSMAAELRLRPQLRDSFAMTVRKNTGPDCAVESDSKNDQFTFAIHWDCTRPLTARLSVGTHCFEDVIARESGNDHLRDTLTPGEFATCLIGRTNSPV